MTMNTVLEAADLSSTPMLLIDAWEGKMRGAWAPTEGQTLQELAREYFVHEYEERDTVLMTKAETIKRRWDGWELHTDWAFTTPSFGSNFREDRRDSDCPDCGKVW